MAKFCFYCGTPVTEYIDRPFAGFDEDTGRPNTYKACPKCTGREKAGLGISIITFFLVLAFSLIGAAKQSVILMAIGLGIGILGCVMSIKLCRSISGDGGCL